MPSEEGPTPPSERIVSLDALRGFALLGILIINIQVFAMPEIVLFNPTAYGDLTGGNYWVWLFGEVFARQKFITLFTILFGAGVILFMESAERKSDDASVLFFRRSTWLVIFGLAHAYLLWYGDILVGYGLAAFGVVLFRHLPPIRLVRIALVFLAVPSLIELMTGATADPAMIQSAWEPTEAALEEEINTYRSGWWGQFDHRAPAAFERQTSGFVVFTAWRVAGSMLLGMALFKWGVMTNDRSTREYLWLIAGGALAGIGLTLGGVVYIESANWAPEVAMYWRQFNYWGSIPLAIAYVGVVMLYCEWSPAGLITRALAAVGRTAFSNYILQTVLATWIFYGHGLGLFAQLDRVEIFAVVLGIWAVQIVLSVVWLRYFRFGPIEWIWRVLTYRSMQPLRRE